MWSGIHADDRSIQLVVFNSKRLPVASISSCFQVQVPYSPQLTQVPWVAVVLHSQLDHRYRREGSSILLPVTFGDLAVCLVAASVNKQWLSLHWPDEKKTKLLPRFDFAGLARLPN